jgi:hypothetical protein
MIFAKRVVDAWHADDVYRRLSPQGKAQRLKIARKRTKQPESTCPNCRYDLSGCFRNDDSLRPCPECGRLVSPGAVIMAWYRESKLLVTHYQALAYSGLFQALLAWVYITLAGLLGGSQGVQRTFLIVWLFGLALNVTVLSYSGLKRRSAADPNRHPLKAIMLPVSYTCGVLCSTTLFFLLPVGIDFVVYSFVSPGDG